MSEDIKFAPFRPFDDFIGNANNFSIPNLNDLERLNNRITNNLLYYQTNYIVIVVITCIVVGIMNPLEFMVGLIVTMLLFAGFIYFKNNNLQVQNLIHNKPYINLIVLTILSGFILNAIGSILVFLFSICMPLTIVFIHAALRLRNLSNKIANKVENVGIKRTVMGYLLEQLGAAHEAAS